MYLGHLSSLPSRAIRPTLQRCHSATDLQQASSPCLDLFMAGCARTKPIGQDGCLARRNIASGLRIPDPKISAQGQEISSSREPTLLY